MSALPAKNGHYTCKYFSVKSMINCIIIISTSSKSKLSFAFKVASTFLASDTIDIADTLKDAIEPMSREMDCKNEVLQ